ncbi:hypothetical protein CLOM_g22867 [Closterium sp. NIES-68]|nr:hypothetical protein CLOM_g22867 [Closterium sp. NIES-68]GJP65501.1 hypothetical protein CLOP_g22386 [Closterium sp. NIES-67]GJP70311.1 hypothetical protein CLOP_g1258 [Closterium sp. NIES-67]
MVLIAAVRDYVNKMLNDVSGPKVLILDAETLPIVSLVLTQSEVLHRDVVLVEKVDSKGGGSGGSSSGGGRGESGGSGAEPMPHLKAVCFLRPTGENVNHLKRHLRNPRFGEYHLFFSNILNSTLIHVLADADAQEAVVQVQEYYADFYALDAFHFTLHVPLNVYSYVSATVDLNNTQRVAERSVDALLALCLSLKKRPTIRFQRGSELARRVAHETGRIMYEAEKPLFDFRRTDALPLLLVVDRRDDPVTPLLMQWTYQAMVHELIGIKDNKVDLSHVPNISPDQREVVLAAGEDEFFRRHMNDNFGDVGNAVAKLVNDLQSKDRRNKGIQTLDDMAAVLESYPEYRRQAGNVAKHVAIMTELQRVVGGRKLMAVSEVEQELACTSGQTAAFEAVAAKLSSQDVADVDKLRLVMLYALRYEQDSPRHLQALINKFNDVCRNPKYKAGLIYTLLRQFGVKRRVADLYGSRDLLNMVARNVKRGLTGVENVYTQHQPLIAQIIDAATKGRLSEADYPFISGNFQQSRTQDLIVFVVGGTTYEEARTVALFNAANPNIRVVLGGTALLNSTRFIEEVSELNHLEASVGLD